MTSVSHHLRVEM